MDHLNKAEQLLNSLDLDSLPDGIAVKIEDSIGYLCSAFDPLGSDEGRFILAKAAFEALPECDDESSPIYQAAFYLYLAQEELA